MRLYRDMVLLAHEERIAIEKACEEHIKMIREYRAQMNEIVEQYLSGIKAGIDQKEASDTNKASEYKVERAKEKANESRKNCGAAIDKLGERKVAVLDGSMKKFISEFEKLNHVELSESSIKILKDIENQKPERSSGDEYVFSELYFGKWIFCEKIVHRNGVTFYNLHSGVQKNEVFVINYQDLQGIGMTHKLALPTLIALCSIGLGRPVQSSMVVIGDFSIGGTIMKADNLASTLQVCLDSGAKKVLLPQISAVDLGTVPAELMSSFSLVFYQSAEDAVFKALGVE